MVRGAATATALAIAVLSACTGKDPYAPGTPLGTYHVEAKNTANGCGEANAPPNPWDFDVKLARDGTTLYWIQGGPPVSGHLDGSGRAVLTTSDERTLHEADPKRQLGYCAVTRTDTLDTTLGAAEADGGVDGFTGSLVYRFTATDGSDCSDVVAAGTFATLPCEIRFDLAAKK